MAVRSMCACAGGYDHTCRLWDLRSNKVLLCYTPCCLLHLHCAAAEPHSSVHAINQMWGVLLRSAFSIWIMALLWKA